ncbi:MAG: PAS domain S-box protein [Nitrospiraceae bacterium]|nr:PAS domain S-box protein [Nitrospiraceae bacterium]
MRLCGKLRSINLWHLVWVVVLSEICTAILVVSFSYLWWGHFSRDVFFIGVIVSFIVSVLVGYIIIYLFQQSRDAEKKYRILVENAWDAICLLDIEGNFLEVNLKIEELSGYRKEELLNMNFSRLCPAEGVGTSFEHDIRIGAPYEVTFVRKDGDTFPAEMAVAIAEYKNRHTAQVTIRDITGRKLMEKDLERLRVHLEDLVKERTAELAVSNMLLKQEIADRKFVEERLNLLKKAVESIPIGITITDAERKIVYTNPAEAEMHGYAIEELLDCEVKIFAPPETWRPLNLNLLSREAWQRESINVRKDGSLFPVLLTSVPVTDDTGVSAAMITLCEDITEKMKLQEEAKFIQTKLIQANKMTALGTLVSGVAHEINNPNNFILFNTQLLAASWEDIIRRLSESHGEEVDFPVGGLPYSEMKEIIPKLLSGISEGSRRIKSIVGGLKSFARQESARMDSCIEINKVVTASAAILANQTAKCTDRFHLDFAEDLPPVKGNAQQLEQVIINLLMNALHALNDRSKGIWISTASDDVARCVIIRVKDEGLGMTAEVLERIMEPFFTTRLEQGGTGLGLSISYSIIKDHGGSLKFDSLPGCGTTVTVTLPADQSVTVKEG